MPHRVPVRQQRASSSYGRHHSPTEETPTRVRTILTACAAVLLLSGAQPASAGTGDSTYCSDGMGWREVPVLTTPVTVGLEITQPSVAATSTCCRATAPAPRAGRRPARAARSASIGFAPTCDTEDSADLALDDVKVSAPPSSVCLVSVGAGCAAYVPGVKVVTNANPSRALIQVSVLGTPVMVSAPAQCVAVVVACP